MAQHVSIRIAKSNDVETIFNIRMQAQITGYTSTEQGITKQDIELYFQTLIENGRERYFEKKRQQLNLSHSKTWIAVSRNVSIGYCMATKGDKYNGIYSLFILPDHQGKGAGTLLLTKALNWLGPKKDVHLQVVGYNQRAISFYERFGFECITKSEKLTFRILTPTKKIQMLEMARFAL